MVDRYYAPLQRLSGIFLVLLCGWSLPQAFGQNDTYQSLLAEANALSGLTDVNAYASSASDLLTRAEAALSDDQLQTIEDKVDQVASNWLLQNQDGSTLIANTVEFVVARGLAKLTGTQRSEVAARWILQEGAMSRLSPATINRLSEAAVDVLTQSQRDRLSSEGLANLGDLGSLSFEDLKEHIVTRVPHLYSDDENGRVAKRKIVVDWASTRDPAALNVESLDWLMMEMLPKWMSEFPPQEINAVWQTQLSVPRNGQYKFALSPLNLTATREDDSHRYFRLWVTVEINGQKILEAAPGSWMHESEPIELDQNQAAALKMTLRYQMAGYVPLPASGQLYWSGPGMSKQLIGESFFRLPDVDEGGIRLSIERRNASGSYTSETVVDMIDQVIGKHAVCNHERLLQRYINKRLDAFLSPEFMNQAVADATKPERVERLPHPFTVFPDYRGIVNKTSSAQRRSMALAFSLHPEIFGPLDLWTMVYFHDAVRFGAEREALDMLGTWMTVHADYPPQLAADSQSFFDTNRAAYRHLIIPLVIEHAESAEWLEQDYLITEDGTCNLPVATVVCYVHLVSGRMLEWIEKLDARLAEESAVGDIRVNWLIARAVAEEVRSCPQDHVQYPGCHRFGAGFGWLDEAMLVSKTPAVKQRVVQERVARFAALGKWDQADAELERIPELSHLKAKLDEIRTNVAQQLAQDRIASDKSVLAEMRRRQSRAVARGDSTNADKYAAIIEQLEDSDDK